MCVCIYIYIYIKANTHTHLSVSLSISLSLSIYIYREREREIERYKAAVASYQPDWRDVWGVEPIAEFVLAAVFEWNYRLRERGQRFADCAWGPDAPNRCPSPAELTSHPVLMNQTIGVLGYGKIGKAVARRSTALGMRTVATKVHGPFTPTPQDRESIELRESKRVVLGDMTSQTRGWCGVLLTLVS